MSCQVHLRTTRVLAWLILNHHTLLITVTVKMTNSLIKSLSQKKKKKKKIDLISAFLLTICFFSWSTWSSMRSLIRSERWKQGKWFLEKHPWPNYLQYISQSDVQNSTIITSVLCDNSSFPFYYSLTIQKNKCNKTDVQVRVNKWSHEKAKVYFNYNIHTDNNCIWLMSRVSLHFSGNKHFYFCTVLSPPLSTEDSTTIWNS